MTWYPHTVTVAAASEPITLAEARTQTRFDDDTSNDTALGLYIASARSHIEARCGTPIVSRTITVKCDSFDDFAAFPVVPLQSVSSVSYVDGAGDTQTLATSVYEVRSDGLTASLALKNGQSWPSIQSGSRVTVTAVVGYAAVPDEIKHALLLFIAQAERGREAFDMAGIESLLTNHRVFAGA